MSRAKAEERYGKRLLVAALGAIEKNEFSFRVTHDATHKVKINPKIRYSYRDQKPHRQGAENSSTGRRSATE